ncbi:MAG: hypothetical protein HQ518_10920 [Rhodopirellula sp.]|nr:hypothetical protein [Rhodopirellula sp.]
MNLLYALKNSTTQFDFPYTHWIVDQPVTPDVLTEVVTTPMNKGPRAFDGTRAADDGGGGLDAKLRLYITDENVADFPALGKLIDELLAPETVLQFEKMLQRDLGGAYLRVEAIADVDGFWLKPHKDIKEKLMSMLVYVNIWGEAEELGTDIYDDNLNVVKTIPYRNNLGYLFAPGDNTWHGLEKKTIKTVRRSILINYVTFETCWKVPKIRRQKAAA